MSDVIVVGAGSGGAVVARRLVDAGAHVLLLEAGGRDENPAIHDPGRVHELWLSDVDWAYETVPQRHANGRRLAWPRGKVLGGSSSLNAMIWVRGAPADFDTWGDGWAWDDVLPVYERLEAELGLLTSFEPGRHVQAGRRWSRGRRSTAAGARHRRPPRRGRVGDAERHDRQHERAIDHDR